jgi:hypothetical protein
MRCLRGQRADITQLLVLGIGGTKGWRMVDHESRPIAADPDFMMDLVSTLSALAALAQLGVSWLQFKQSSHQRTPADRESFSQPIRDIRKNLRELFENLDEVFRIYNRFYEEQNKRELGREPVRSEALSLFR